MPVMAAMCATCVFLPEIEAQDPDLADSVKRRLLKSSLHCHSTGYPVGTHLCRGARDWQLQVLYRLGVLEAPTDEAWEKRLLATSPQRSPQEPRT